MPTIANLNVKADGSFEGTLATLNVTALIAIVPNGRKAKDSEPDYRIISRKNGFELGAGWKRFSQNNGAESVSVTMSAADPLGGHGGMPHGTRSSPALDCR